MRAGDSRQRRLVAVQLRWIRRIGEGAEELSFEIRSVREHRQRLVRVSRDHRGVKLSIARPVVTVTRSASRWITVNSAAQSDVGKGSAIRFTYSTIPPTVCHWGDPQIRSMP